jgi:hypothetical protein
VFVRKAERASDDGGCAEHREIAAGNHLGEDGADIVTHAVVQRDCSVKAAFDGGLAQGVHGAHRFIHAVGKPFRIADGRMLLDGAHKRLRMWDV